MSTDHGPGSDAAIFAPGTVDRSHHVSAVLVSHNGARWIPRLLAALQEISPAPDAVVAVDTGSSDESRPLLVSFLGPEAVADAPADTGFGAAVAHGLAQLPPVDVPTRRHWLWLLHDDCAPAAEALGELLAVATSAEEVAVVGPRVRAWPRARRLLEVGLTITGTGHRETGLEPGEFDQGQHDDQRDVLAVGTAGMLVRMDVWEALGGFDPCLPLFRDDVDFGWRVTSLGQRVVVAPAALVFHAEAATRGVRAIDNAAPSAHRADRRAALYTLLVNGSAAALPWRYLRLGGGSLLRAIGYLLGKLPTAAVDEVRALAWVLARPDRIVRGRSARRRQRLDGRSPDHRAASALLPPWWLPYAQGADSWLGQLAADVRDRAATAGSSVRQLPAGRGDGSALETGPVPEEAENLPAGAGPVSWVRRHQLLALTTLLAVLALVATRGLHGAGFLRGGSLLPVPGSTRQWWQLYTETWHRVGLGSDAPAAPYVAVLAVAGTMLLGKAWLVADLLLLFGPVLGAAGAYVAARRLVAGQVLPVWAALSYACVLAVSGVAVGGHVGTAAAMVVLPWLVRAAVPLADVTPGTPWGAGFATGVTLSLLVAFVPLAWPMAAAVGLSAVVVAVVTRRFHRAAPILTAVALPIVLLLPWSLRFLEDPRRLLVEAGVVDRTALGAADIGWRGLSFGRLGEAGAGPWWLTAGFVLVALVALTRASTRTRVAGAWVAIAVALATVAVIGDEWVPVPGTDQLAHAWLGFPVLVVQVGALAAAAFAADGWRADIASASFGWRQPVAVLCVVVASASTVAGLAWWVGAAPHGDLARQPASTLPRYMTDATQARTTQRILAIHTDTDPVSYNLRLGDGERLGDDGVLAAEESPKLTALVADLISQGRPADIARLADFAVAYVVLPRPHDAAVVAEIDAIPGLSRASTNARQLAGWQVDAPTGLDREVRSADGSRRWWLVGQGCAWLLALVLAAPGARRPYDKEPVR
ncbi:MAG: glycosyltransferase family 2 protein [Nocardioidaceae bacterium]|nr:glycosyltransferase family 2 protein [Nocardioidaceae bacterium]